VGLGLAFCRCEKCSHGLGALKRSSEPLSGRRQAEGASGQGNTFLFGKEPAHVRSPIPEGKLYGATASDKYPGFDLSISELCNALKTKLTTRGNCTAPRNPTLQQLIQLTTLDTPFPSHWFVTRRIRR